jgi:hypothetical protein
MPIWYLAAPPLPSQASPPCRGGGRCATSIAGGPCRPYGAPRSRLWFIKRTGISGPAPPVLVHQRALPQAPGNKPRRSTMRIPLGPRNGVRAMRAAYPLRTLHSALVAPSRAVRIPHPGTRFGTASPSNQGPCFGVILLGGGLGAQNFPSGAPEPAPRAELEACFDRTKSKEQRGRPGWLCCLSIRARKAATPGCVVVARLQQL